VCRCTEVKDTSLSLFHGGARTRMAQWRRPATPVAFQVAAFWSTAAAPKWCEGCEKHAPMCAWVGPPQPLR